MTPEDLDRMHAEAVAAGVDPEKLERQRREALQECGSPEEMARWADFDQRLATYWSTVRGRPSP
ncbi:hypothetical protein GCM10022252_09670 [Streptosporangium oxazolinicum]|uniref:Uncharacterized protein n=1 Tax=Streptosporangium oxazolinicum TaxID=909287 RepID=A0ABP8AF71_9ACTN